MARSEGTMSKRARYALAGLLAVQALLGLFQVNAEWTRGHNGWNSSAYHQSAKNSLRWGLLFPLQYYTGTEEQPADAVYTHAPLGMHLHDTAAMWVLGDERYVVRGVAASFAVLAVFALFFVVHRLWGEAHAILAAALYVALPINAIFLNMANHVSGFLAFSLLSVDAYLRLHEAREAEARGEAETGARRWLLTLYGTFALSAFWDWPANYVALMIAAHWLFSAARRAKEARGALRRDLAGLAGFCALVLAMFAGHLALVWLATGSLDELLHTANVRQGTFGFSWGHHLRTVPLLMFSWPVLALTGAWIVAAAVRLFRGSIVLRDAVPFVFGVAGVAHYVIFRHSAVVHEFWAWYTLPFVAIACATSLLAAGRFLAARVGGARGRVVAAGILVAFMTPFVVHAARVIPDGRRVGGSMWFVAPVRGPEPFPYDSGRVELRFAELVREWTDRETGVLVHRGFYRRVPEPRWDITLDREIRRVATPPRVVPAPSAGVRGWVFVGESRDLSELAKRELSARHPFVEVGPFFFVDFRERRPERRAYDLVDGPMTAAHAFFVSPFEPPLVLRARHPD